MGNNSCCGCNETKYEEYLLQEHKPKKYPQQNITSYDDDIDNKVTNQEVHSESPSAPSVDTKNDNKDESEEEETELRVHSVQKSMKIINKYDGNNNIQSLRRIYMKEYNKNMINNPSRLKKIKSTHSVAKSKKIIDQHKNQEISMLKKKYKKTKKKKNNALKNNDNKEDDKENNCNSGKMKRNKSTHSIVKSNKIINEYKGNDDIALLRKIYMKMYDENIKHTIGNDVIMPKPENIEDFMTKTTNIWHKELCEYITNHTRYIGMAQFRDNNEFCIELEFTSNNNGYIAGQRIMIDNTNKERLYNKIIKINGKGKIYKDAIWNIDKNEYEGCIKFEWMDKNDGIVTKLLFNTNTNDFDIDHLYFEGMCCQYSSDLNLNNVDIENVDNNDNINKGVFNMVCVSMRTRNFLKRDALLNYHEIDIWNMSDDQLKQIPKYIKCINIASVKMNQMLQHNSSK